MQAKGKDKTSNEEAAASQAHALELVHWTPPPLHLAGFFVSAKVFIISELEI